MQSEDYLSSSARVITGSKPLLWVAKLLEDLVLPKVVPASFLAPPKECKFKRNSRTSSLLLVTLGAPHEVKAELTASTVNCSAGHFLNAVTFWAHVPPPLLIPLSSGSSCNDLWHTPNFTTSRLNTAASFWNILLRHASQHCILVSPGSSLIWEPGVTSCPLHCFSPPQTLGYIFKCLILTKNTSEDQELIFSLGFITGSRAAQHSEGPLWTCHLFLALSDRAVERLEGEVLGMLVHRSPVTIRIP